MWHKCQLARSGKQLKINILIGGASYWSVRPKLKSNSLFKFVFDLFKDNYNPLAMKFRSGLGFKVQNLFVTLKTPPANSTIKYQQALLSALLQHLETLDTVTAIMHRWSLNGKSNLKIVIEMSLGLQITCFMGTIYSTL